VRTTFAKPDSIIIYLRELVNEGKIPIETINSRVRDVLKVKFKTGLFDSPYVKDANATRKLVNSEAHQEIALRASRESIVLLKNQENILPVQKGKKIAVIGPNATDADYAHTHYGPLKSPSVNVLDGIIQKVGVSNVKYSKGCDLVDKRWPESELLPEEPTAAEQKMIDEAITIAKESEQVVLVLGGNTQTAGENKSRISLDLTGHQLLLAKEIVKVGKPVVVIFIGSQPISFNWIDKNVKGIIYAGYPGVKGGIAVADVLFGDYNPGGKITLTFPRSVGQIPLNFPTKPNAQTDAGENAKAKGLLYPFGYGLSYTKFQYSDLKIVNPTISANEAVNLSVTVQNIGAVKGDEVVQLYIRDEVSSVTTYEKNLRGFERVSLAPNERKTINFTVQPDDLALWNREMKRVVEPGKFIVMVGASSSNIKLKGSFMVK